MSGLLQKISSLFGIKKKSVKVIMIGLNNSGKSTIVGQLKSEGEKNSEIVPTVGLNVEQFRCKFNFFIYNLPNKKLTPFVLC